jgi:hypothetical protein
MKRTIMLTLTLAAVLLLSLPAVYAVLTDEQQEDVTQSIYMDGETPAPSPAPSPPHNHGEETPLDITKELSDITVLLITLVIGIGALFGAAIYFITRGAWEVS